jgi:hypothetical protein
MTATANAAFCYPPTLGPGTGENHQTMPQTMPKIKATYQACPLPPDHVASIKCPAQIETRRIAEPTGLLSLQAGSAHHRAPQ